MKSKVRGRQNGFVRVITIPYRALCKARDFYVRSITGCSDMSSYRPTNMRGGLPKSYSVSSTMSSESEDFRELVRASSSSRTIELQLHELYGLQQPKKTGPEKMPRSSSVAMGSIDEDRPCNYFGDMNENLKKEIKYPRSKSHALPTISAF